MARKKKKKKKPGVYSAQERKKIYAALLPFSAYKKFIEASRRKIRRGDKLHIPFPPALAERVKSEGMPLISPYVMRRMPSTNSHSNGVLYVAKKEKEEKAQCVWAKGK